MDFKFAMAVALVKMRRRIRDALYECIPITHDVIEAILLPMCLGSTTGQPCRYRNESESEYSCVRIGPFEIEVFIAGIILYLYSVRAGGKPQTFNGYPKYVLYMNHGTLATFSNPCGMEAELIGLFSICAGDIIPIDIADYTCRRCVRQYPCGSLHLYNPDTHHSCLMHPLGGIVPITALMPDNWMFERAGFIM